jgi:hypothetical protein
VAYDRDQVVRVVLKKPPSEARKRAVERVLLDHGQEGNDLEWSGRELLLHQYRPHSYGYLRRAIDVLNKE